MINVKEYIESGILEDYLSGNVSDQERREVECLSKIYPEIKTELDSLSDTIEQFAFANKVAAPAALKSKIMAQLTFAEDEPETQVEQIVEEEEDNVPVLPLNSRANSFQWGWVAAASVAALVGSVVYFNARLETLSTTVAQQQNEIKVQTTQIAQLNDANNQFVTLKGVEKSPSSSVRVVWNPKTQEVQLSVLSLPTPSADKQYQLWALVEGKPVDLGVFDVSTAFQKMKTTGQAEAFAVTLEKKGGNPTPHLEELYVMGKVAG